MNAKKLLSLSLAVLMLLASALSFTSCAENDGYTVGICQLVEHPALDQATKGFKDYLTERLGDKVTFEEKLAQGELTNCQTIVNGFVSSKVDLIMGNATNAVKAAREATDTIPVVGTSVTDYVTSGLITANDKPGANVTGASDYNPVTNQISLLKKLVPNAKVIGIIYCSAEENSKIQADEAKAALEKEGYTVKTYAVADVNELQLVTTSACAEVDAFYEPTDNLIAANVSVMANITNAQKKPVIAAEEGMCTAGFLATYAISYYDLGRAAGEMAYEILVNGKKPAEVPVYFFDEKDLTLIINEENAATLGITIPEDLKPADTGAADSGASDTGAAA